MVESNRHCIISHTVRPAGIYRFSHTRVNVDINKVRKAAYNPRYLSTNAREGLRESMDDFGDISGICINKKTGNVFAGNHRFDEISKKHGRSNLSLISLEGEWYSLGLLDGSSTGFKVRVVDWELDKEQLANVVANNDLITGEYTTELQPLLKKIQVTIPKIRMDNLRVSPMVIDDTLEDDIDLDDEYETPEKVKIESEKASRKSRTEEVDETAPSNVRNIVSNIKVVGPSDRIDEITFDILEALSRKDYYDEINIIKGKDEL